MPIRLIDAGIVPALRSQTIYHAVAHCFTDDSQDTILLATPATAYVSIGYHQDLEREVNVEHCLATNMEIVRREVGGGVVYLDKNQLFTQWVFSPSSFPMSVEERFRLHAYPIVMTYKDVGIDAFFKPASDIRVRPDKKIGGLGAAGIGGAEVVVGNFLYDFNFEVMSQVLNVSNEQARLHLLESLRTYMTTINQQIDSPPDYELLKSCYISNCEKILKQPIEPGDFSQEELDKMHELDQKFAASEWVESLGAHARPALKIHGDVWLGDLETQTHCGLLSTTVRMKNNCVDDIQVHSDNRDLPEEYLSAFQQKIPGAMLEHDELTERVSLIVREYPALLQEAEAHEWVRSVVTVAQAVKTS